jgi:hypothetical protein
VAEGSGARRDPGAVARGVQRVGPGSDRSGLGHREEHDLVEQGHRVEQGVGLRRHDVVVLQQADVEPALAQCRRHRDRVALGDHQLQLRVLGAHGDEGRGQQRADRCREGADAQRPAQSRGDRCQGSRAALEGGEDGLGVLDEDVPGGGEGHAPAAALEQRCPGLPLQCGQRLGDRRRRVAARARDGRDRAEVRQVAEQLEAAHVEHQRTLRFASGTCAGPDGCRPRRCDP